MNCTIKGLSWAAITIVAAYVAKQSGMNDTGAMLLIGAMLAAFFATSKRSARCGSC
ncbi:hypothetical protein [Sphingomicrobium clamense]|uniref:Uncharacterized protein n=1 Tax=Sphingomicrobium clamense TaxID=2851013 RepID=A0ABS6V4I9_9SPHN|nr:hypothetical protein [Sphingomicrobium sp. B8]MBW0144112.1 hypothetical protein [Sphingomicrobium sp. B8]